VPLPGVVRILDATVEPLEGFTEGVMQLVGRITKHRQPAALLWPFQAEAADDSEAARLQGVQHLLDRALPLLSAGQEMEHRPVMPDVEGGSRQIGLQHIRSKPVHGFACRAEVTPGGIQGSGRDVQHREPCEAGGKQIVYQSRFLRPHVDDRPSKVGAARQRYCKDVFRWGARQPTASADWVS